MGKLYEKNSLNSKYNFFKIMLDIFVLFNEGSKFYDVLNKKCHFFWEENLNKRKSLLIDKKDSSEKCISFVTLIFHYALFLPQSEESFKYLTNEANYSKIAESLT